jgi:hypothetical protein
MAQVSNVQSRTLRVLGSLPDSVKTSLSELQGVVVLEKESKGFEGKSKTFLAAEEVAPVIQLLSANNVIFRPHFYSIFAKFSSELKPTEVDKLNEKVYAVAPDAEVSYSRIDANGHTGKIVVDRFEDYNLLRAFSGDVTFYKFNRTKAQTRGPVEGQAAGARQPYVPRQSTGPRQSYAPRRQSAPEGADSEGFQVQTYRGRPRVSRDVPGAGENATPYVPRATGAPRGRGAPRASRGRGAPRAAPTSA